MDNFGSSLDVINLVNDYEETFNSAEVNGGTGVEETLVPVADSVESITEAPAEQNDGLEQREEVDTDERVAPNEAPQ